MLNSGTRSTTSLINIFFLDSSTLLPSLKLKKVHSLVDASRDKMAWSGTSQDQMPAPEESENYLLLTALEPQLVPCGEPGMSLHHHQLHHFSTLGMGYQAEMGAREVDSLA